MKTFSRLAVVFLLGVSFHGARADYAFIPDYKKLEAKLGIDIVSTDTNFATDGVLDPTAIGTTQTRVGKSHFWLQGEYGIAQDWAVLLNVGFANSSVTRASDGSPLLAGSGLADTTLSLRWSFRPVDPILTAEIYGRLPAASTAVLTGESVVTNGSVDVGFKLHAAHRAGIVAFALSPGAVLRSGGFSGALTGDAAVDLDFKKGYIRAFASLIYSFEETPLNDSSLLVHDTPGTGGSYLFLSGSPIGMYAGGKLGFRFFEELVVEGGVTKTVFGTRYPDFFGVQFALGYTFDFFKPIPAKKVKEVPFDEDQDDFYKNR